MNRRNYGDSLVNLVGLQKQLLPKNPATPALVGCQSWEVQVSIQKNIIELLVKLQKERDLCIVFICHDIALVQYVGLYIIEI